MSSATGTWPLFLASGIVIAIVLLRFFALA